MSSDSIKVNPALENSAIAFALDKINNLYYPIYKQSFGAIGEQTPVSQENPLPIGFQTDSANFDAFSRLRTSGTGQRLDVEFIYDKQDDYFDEVTNNGTVTLNGNTRDLTLSLSDAVDGSYATMASHPVPYTPGNSQLIDITGVLDLAEIGGGTAEVFLRSSVTGSITEETIVQSAWTNATTGVDWTKSHIFAVDFQSLKVGRIRFTLNRGGLPVPIAEITNDNEKDSGYWQLPSLPAYWKIYNDATDTYMEMGYGNDNNAVGIRYKITANANATMKAICCTVKSEGGQSLTDMAGLPRAADNDITSVAVSTTLVPILSIRLKSTFNTYDNLSISLPKSFSLEITNPVKLVILHDAVLTGADWKDVDTESAMEFDVASSAVANGHKIHSDYISASRKNVATSSQGLLGKTVMWSRKSTRTGILTIAAIRTGDTDSECLSSFQWEEIR